MVSEIPLERPWKPVRQMWEEEEAKKHHEEKEKNNVGGRFDGQAGWTERKPGR